MAESSRANRSHKSHHNSKKNFVTARHTYGITNDTNNNSNNKKPELNNKPKDTAPPPLYPPSSAYDNVSFLFTNIRHMQPLIMVKLVLIDDDDEPEKPSKPVEDDEDTPNQYVRRTTNVTTTVTDYTFIPPISGTDYPTAAPLTTFLDEMVSISIGR